MFRIKMAAYAHISEWSVTRQWHYLKGLKGVVLLKEVCHFEVSKTHAKSTVCLSLSLSLSLFLCVCVSLCPSPLLSLSAK